MRVTRAEIAAWPKRIREQIDNQLRDQAARSPADMEQHPIHAVKAKIPAQIMVTPCYIHIHSKRKRLADCDNICAKFAIDGVVDSGLLPDDDAKNVKEVRYSQEKAEEEETIIRVRTLE